MMTATIKAIDALLPQTQCQQCGFEGCLPYATALANNETAINRCPPGGLPVMRALAKLLNVAECALDASCGIPQPPQVVYIEEALCIGCTKCIQACPVDAIIGTKKLMHTVIKEECTGCALCIPPCPLDCIIIAPRAQTTEVSIGLTPLQQLRAQRSRQRYFAKQQRQKARTVVTKTLPPQERVLANSTNAKNMQALIDLAKQTALKKVTKQHREVE